MIINKKKARLFPVLRLDGYVPSSKHGLNGETEERVRGHPACRLPRHGIVLVSWLEWLPVPVGCCFELTIELLNQFFNGIRVPGLNTSLIGGITPGVPMKPVWDRIGRC